MLKIADSVKNLEYRAVDALKALLGQIPAIKLADIRPEPLGRDRGVDILAYVSVAGHGRMLVCKVKADGQPRHVRMALLQLRERIARLQVDDAIPVLIAPYLSAEVQAFCREQGVCFLDFAGNCRLVFDEIFIERLVASKPAAARRELKSIFKPKSAQVLRMMLRDPRRAWRVAELAEAAGVSLGQVSNVRVALLDREWARVEASGLSLSEPDALLDAWREVYEPPGGQEKAFYTVLHGRTFEDAARKALGAANAGGMAAMLASFSAAQWLAPYARVGSHFFYADGPGGLDVLQQELQLSSAAKGANVIITVLQSHDLFEDRVEPAPGVFCTSPVQTYLDLTIAGERGREAADHLRYEKLKWKK